jgi:hypothetical protein
MPSRGGVTQLWCGRSRSSRTERVAPRILGWGDDCRTTALAVVLAVGLVAPASVDAQSVGDGILSFEEHAAGEARALAQVHAGELRALQSDIDRCLAGVAVQRKGIAFRQPRGFATDAPYLTLWVWLTDGRAPGGGDIAARATDAFRRHAQTLFRRLVGRSPVFADPRVGGFGLILTWLGPIPRDGRIVGESLVMFADKLTVANYVFDTIAPSVFLERAGVRIFDGQTEVKLTPLSVNDDVPASDRLGC